MKITVRGQEITKEFRMKRYLVVEVRETPVPVEHGTLVAFASIASTSDSRDTAVRKATRLARTSPALGMNYLVVDSGTYNAPTALVVFDKESARLIAGETTDQGHDPRSIETGTVQEHDVDGWYARHGGTY